MKFSRQRGSLLIITLIFVIVLSSAAISVLELSRTSYRLSMRNQLQAEARAVAESEMEYLYFKFKSSVLAGSAAQGVPATLAAAGVCDNSTTLTPTASGVTPVFVPTTYTPFLASHAAAGWTVHRALVTNRYLQNERFPGTTKEGNFTYLIALIEVVPPASSPFGTTANVRIGRRFMNSSAPIFQYSIFFQGDLEFNPGSSVAITGDVVANGSIYMAPVSGFTMTVGGKVRYLADHYFNTDSSGHTSYSNPSAPTPTATLVAPTFLTSQTDQLETLDEPENLLGGIDVTATATGRPDLFGPAGRTDPTAWTSADLTTAENNVYRSLIVPPPSASTTAEFPNATISTPSAVTDTGDDSVISVQRAYNKASLRIEVDASTGTPTFWKVDFTAGTSTNVTSTFLPNLTRGYAITNWGNVLVPNYRKSVYDKRENTNVNITEINVGILGQIITDQRALLPLDPLNIGLNFNGLLYINLKGASASAPAAVRLINAATLPYTTSVPVTSGLTGFSVATNGGIYVKGDYNTTAPIVGGVPVYPRIEDGTAGYVPAMLIADCITLLSAGWSDTNAAAALSSRVAVPNTSDSTDHTIALNAGLLTGNIPSTATTSSGGAQNLVRYLEDWSGQNVNFWGSIGRLFTSTKFDAPYVGPGLYYGGIYVQPLRSFGFDHNILLYPPPGTPSTTSFSRGSFFTW